MKCRVGFSLRPASAGPAGPHKCGRRLKPTLHGFVFLFAVTACAAIRFEETKLEFHLSSGAAGRFHLIELMPGGVAAFDYDNDSCPDLFFPNGAATPGLGKINPRFWNRLYRNDCKGSFTDVTEAAGLTGEGYAMGAAAADYDNDGHTDLFVPGVNLSLLYRNTGKGTFVETLRLRGQWAVAGAWLDYDNDGRLDLFVVNYVAWNAANEPSCGEPGRRFYCHPAAYANLANQLFRNNGDGTFTDVSERAGIAAHKGKGMSAAAADFDGDGYLDIFVANDSVPGFLFHNRRDGTFREIGLEAGVAYRDDGTAIAGMGADFRDYDNDGRPDLTVTGMINDTFLLFRNAGAQLRFDDDRARMGALLQTRPWTGWGAGLADFDNDGWKDLFFALSHFPRMERYTGAGSAALACRVLPNERGKRFGASVAVGEPAFYHGAAFADFDIDGRVDAAVSAVDGAARLFRNVTEGAGRWLGVRLRGVKANRQGIGATVRVKLPGGATLANVLSAGNGYASSSEAVARFGLGAAERADVEVVWPGGKRQTRAGVAAGQVIEIQEAP